MPQSSALSNSEYQHAPSMEIPFTDLFGTLIQPFDLSEIKATVVPDGFFSESWSNEEIQYQNEQTKDDEILILDLDPTPSLPKPSTLEKKFLYFIFTRLSGRTSDQQDQVDQQTELSQIWQTILELDLKIGINSKASGFNLTKNYKIFLLFQKLGIEQSLPESFTTEAKRFEELIAPLVKTVANELAAQFSDLEMNPPSSQEMVDRLIKDNRVSRAQEIIDIVRNGPQVKDFELIFKRKDANQFGATNEGVRGFIRTNFPLPILNGQIRISRIVGNSTFLYIEPEAWNPEPISKEEYLEKVQNYGIDEVYDRTLLAYVTSQPWIVVPLFNMCQDIPEMAEKMLENLDFMKTEWTDDQKRLLYSLGLIAHEFTHRLQTPEIMAQYETVAKSTWRTTGKWQGFPSEYSSWYDSKIQRGDDLTLQEDMADSVQIFVINDEYLRVNFPERHTFIRQHLPFLVPNSAQELL